jgi:tripartite-type tricarboxylate transporter receptor subunit TctC
MLNAAIGIDVTHVPYRGGVPAIQDLLGGRIDYYCGVSTTAIPLITGNQVNAIALLTRNRSPSLPALATAHEQGLADFDTPIWYAIFLPKNTPSAIVQKLHAAAVAAVDMPAVRRRLQEIGADVPPLERRSPAYLQRFVENEVKKLATAIKAAGLAGQ